MNKEAHSIMKRQNWKWIIKQISMSIIVEGENYTKKIVKEVNYSSMVVF